MYTSTDCIENGEESRENPLKLQYFCNLFRKMRGFVVYNMRKVADTRKMQTDISIVQKMHSLIYQSEAGHACTRTFPASAAEKSAKKAAASFNAAALYTRTRRKRT